MANELILDEESRSKTNGTSMLYVSGAGMDMVFHCIYNLGIVMFRGLEGDIDRKGYILSIILYNSCASL